jgi:hypothetical protein
MRRRLGVVVIAALSALCSAACTNLLVAPKPGEQLFFALQIQDGERVVARPQLLGETGKRLTLRLVTPDRPESPRLALELNPERDGEGYKIQLKLALPGHDSEGGELELGHGEERSLRLADPAHPLTVKVLLMRVASPEFKTYLKLAKAAPATS